MSGGEERAEGEESLAAEWAKKVPDERQRAFLDSLDEAEQARVMALWAFWARAKQQQPSEGDWRVWLMLAGRGYGKTRAGAEWVRGAAQHRSARIALVGATMDETRSIMVEGDCGVLAVCETDGGRPAWEPSRQQLRFRSGAKAFLYSGESPERLRGPEHSHAWCDELAKWAKPDECWINLQLGLRRGPKQAVLVTTTPRPLPLLRRLAADPAVRTTWGRTRDNFSLSDGFVASMEAAYAGTRIGRQELDGELLADIAGSLWPRDLIEKCRVVALGVPLHHPSGGPPPRSGEDFARIVIGVDPPASAGGDACGIVAMGLRRDGVGVVLEDASVAGLSPEGWARAVADAAERWGADRVIAEANQGGDMVGAVLRSAAVALPVRLVHATRGKAVRAEPVSTLYERGRIVHAGVFPELEDELAGFTTRGYEGAGRSPDRADALIWAATELLVRAPPPVPRIRLL